jgi:hypothetical protein
MGMAFGVKGPVLKKIHASCLQLSVHCQRSRREWTALRVGRWNHEFSYMGWRTEQKGSAMKVTVYRSSPYPVAAHCMLTWP